MPKPAGLIPIVIVGAGGHATVIAEIIKKQGKYDIIGYTAPGERVPGDDWGHEYLGNDGILPDLQQKGIVLAAIGVGGTGDNRLRAKLYKEVNEYGFSFPVLIHPSATIYSNTLLGDGTVVAPSAVVNPGVQIGVNVIINSGAIIEHHCIISNHVHVSPGAVICGGVKMSPLVHVGAGSVLVQGVSLGEGAIIGAGAVVLHDVEPWTVVAGNPGRVIKKLKLKE
ncbi:acetyltransferase [Desulfotomaculum copahuensis]|uniref:PglD N-terminal domain-containing protein n=1 Tax=Desulfotomaculum copahuensis TaxID=1838280 RepID=A0A1B7LCG2_9FIRM|nr:acetyltransferase [Desulfotomaculum copahuensis]OAT80386.1 hypothetical protein A6M21_13540 [Desulfotomaculum copahuensis]